MTLLVDTTVWYAAADRGDRHHHRAVELVAADEPLVTTDHVVVETWLLCAARGGAAAADRWWDGLRRGAARIEPVTAADLEAAWAIGQAFPDQGFAITDRTSFAVAERLGLDRVASFDDDFAIYRFGPRRERAFTVVR